MRLCTGITAAVVAAAALTGVLTACSSEPGDTATPTIQEETMSSRLTEADARAAVEKYLSGTLAVLPPQISFSLQHPSAAHARLSGGGSVPCNDADYGPDADLTFGVHYWVIGVPESETARYLGVFEDAWQRQGWSTDTSTDDGPGRHVRALAPDDYRFIVTDNGQGILTVGASSPCFPGGTRDGGSMPTDITHP